jgi:hypothetical protein
MRRLLLLAAGVAAAVSLAGCGGGPTYVPVSGRVTLDGKPHPNAFVSFQPISNKDNPNPGKGSMGLTDKDGRFVLQWEAGKDGALVGEHRVRIYTGSKDKGQTEDYSQTGTPDGIIQPKGVKPEMELDPIPLEWHEKSEKTFTVPPGGTDQANFDIVTKKGGKKK